MHKLNKTTRGICLVMLLSLLLPLLTGCGEEEGQTVTLRMLSIMGDEGRQAIYSQVLTDFSKQHPQIYLRDTTSAPEESFKLKASLAETYAHGGSPDLVYYYADDGMRSLGDTFVPIEEVRKDYPEFLSDICDSVIESAKDEDGKTRCIPIMGSWTAICVNTELLNKASVTVPQSFRELVSAVETLSGSDIIPFANTPEDCSVMVQSLVRDLGGERALTEGLEGVPDTTGTAWQQSFDIMSRLYRIGAFAPAALTSRVSGYVSDSDGYDRVLGAERDKTIELDAVELWNSGKAAMIIADSSMYPQLNIDDNTRLIDIPHYTDDAFTESTEISGSDTAGGSDSTDGGRLTVRFGEGFYISKKSYGDPLKRQLIIELIEDFASAQTGERFAALGWLSSSKTAKSGAAVMDEMNERLHSGCEISENLIIDKYTSRWSYVDRLNVQLYFDIITPKQLVELLTDRRLSTEDILAQIEPTVSGSDAQNTSDSDATG